MSDTSRLFTALILSAACIFAYNYFFIQPKMKKLEEQKKIELSAQENNKQAQLNSDTTSVAVKNRSDETVVETENSVSKLVERLDVINSGFEGEKRVAIDTPKLHGSINLQGAVFDDLTLANYKQTREKESPEVVLLSPKNTKELYLLRTGWIAADNNVTTPDENSVWKLTGSKKLQPGSDVEITWKSPEGVIFRKIISIDDNYMIAIKEVVVNKSSDVIKMLPFGLVNRTWEEHKEAYISHEGPLAVADNVLHEATYKDIAKEEKQSFENVSGWTGIADKYWLTAIMPEGLDKHKFDINFSFYNKNAQNRYQVDILGGEFEVPAKQKVEYSFRVYAGAKQLGLLDGYAKSQNIPLFDRSIDFGSLYFLTNPIFRALTYFNKHIGNFGLAILLLTVCVRLILFPLANKSYKSMAMMKKHAPDIEKIKERYKNDRQKLSQEIMKYYKDHKINPMSGCLPMLIQIPVFFALYKTLYVTIEMRHAPFYGYIKDLSEKDPTDIFNLFGLLPYTPPSFLPVIGLLPILFSLSMFLQQKLSPPAGDETQRMVISFMPWILLFVFASFPSGLVLYWVWNNILSMAQQYIITKRIERDKNA